MVGMQNSICCVFLWGLPGIGFTVSEAILYTSKLYIIIKEDKVTKISLHLVNSWKVFNDSYIQR